MGYALYSLSPFLDKLIITTHSIHLFRGIRHAHLIKTSGKVPKVLSNVLGKDGIKYLQEKVSALSDEDLRVFKFKDFDIEEVNIYNEETLSEIALPEAMIEAEIEDYGDENL
jgi:hypothetical protein